VIANTIPKTHSRGKTMFQNSKGFPIPSRRDWLKAAGAAGAALVSWPALGATAEETGNKAPKNLKLGIMSSVYAAFPVAEAARRIKADGFVNVLCDYAFADVRFNPAQPDWNAAKKIVQTLEGQGIKIAAVFGYYNVVDPILERRKQERKRMEFLLQNWKRLGCPIVSTETGTYNAQSQWLDSPRNQTEEAYRECRRELASLARIAEKAGAVLTIEAYWRNIIGSIDRAERLMREVNSPGLRLVMDPCNYFRKEELPQMQSMLETMFGKLGKYVAVAHAKDVKAAPDGTDLPAAGQGVLDYPLYLRLLAQLGREIDLIVEHLSLAEVARTREFVLKQMEKI
jgi:sugar phosphate isomerase/epimerase